MHHSHPTGSPGYEREYVRKTDVLRRRPGKGGVVRTYLAQRVSEQAIQPVPRKRQGNDPIRDVGQIQIESTRLEPSLLLGYQAPQERRSHSRRGSSLSRTSRTIKRHHQGPVADKAVAAERLGAKAPGQNKCRWKLRGGSDLPAQTIRSRLQARLLARCSKRDQSVRKTSPGRAELPLLLNRTLPYCVRRFRKIRMVLSQCNRAFKIAEPSARNLVIDQLVCSYASPIIVSGDTGPFACCSQTKPAYVRNKALAARVLCRRLVSDVQCRLPARGVTDADRWG